ncbi:YcxB family protein [Xanthomonas maliensis]|uniref:YcxB family protein n=1 Tax=Xanthomonas maliensis TaxID=1321368 RepID=UPI0003A6ABFC|nr:YcxB family protein [Xanthomonas maliensis]KAB7772275.1 hypothetical protein CKY51_01445 [Xanthomonas maliensis]
MNTITASISLEDHMAAQRLHARHQAVRASVFLGVLLLVGLGLLLSGAGKVFGAMLLGGCGGGVVALAVLHLWGIRWRVKRLHAQHVALRHTYTYSWDEDGIEIRWSAGHLRRPWSDYLRCRENARILLLYHNDQLFELFAPHWFADKAQYEAFRQLALRVGKGARSV